MKNWITFNEPHTFAIQGYDVGLEAPGRCSILLHLFCRAGNSATEPYIVGHNILLSHAAAADIYRKNYKVTIHRYPFISLFLSYIQTCTYVLIGSEFNFPFPSQMMHLIMSHVYKVSVPKLTFIIFIHSCKCLQTCASALDLTSEILLTFPFSLIWLVLL